MRLFADINLHLTDFCNQNCSFCFASEEMTFVTKKEMSYKLYLSLAQKLKQDGVMNINFLGGEPTLNTQFPKILKHAVKNFFLVRIFTNGIFNEKIKTAIRNGSPRVYLVVNISTPGFYRNKKIRDLILGNVCSLAPKTPITLSVVSTFMNTEAVSLLDLIPSKLIRQVMVKLTLMMSIAGQTNPYSIDDFPKIGKNLCKIIEYTRQKGLPKHFRFCSFYRPCMFNKKQREYLKKIGLQFITRITDCHAETKGGASCECHVTSDSSVFRCYPLSTVNILKFDKKSSFTKIRSKYKKIQDRYKNQLIIPQCRKCPYFGFEEGKCTGPCFSFRINALRKERKEERTQPAFLSNLFFKDSLTKEATSSSAL